jgi:hypothetical protein
MSDKDRDIELTPEEAEAFRNLPREAYPSELVEERVVRQLRARQLLRPRFAPLRRTVRWSAAAAAALLLFTAGTAVGRWWTLRSSAGTSAASEPETMEAVAVAARVQQAGSAFVAALVTLNEQQARAGTPEQKQTLAQGGEAAVSVLDAAAEEVARMRTPQVAQELGEVQPAPDGGPGAAVATQQTLWF